MPSRHALILPAAAALLTACGTAPPVTPPATTTAAPPASAPARSAQQPPPQASTKYYKDDGPGESPPPNLDAIPDAVPKLEPLHRAANRPYNVFGRDYVPATTLKAYRERGVASWYGRKFHGQKTSTGETYDMYAMTAAHPTLPLPSYARVTNVITGKSVLVRVNDRGPFLHDRVIDLSFAAAQRIGIAQKGSGEVEVESVIPAADLPAVTATAPLPPLAASEPKTPPPMPIASAGTGYSVQLGAFANFANAQAFLAHMQNQLVAAQVEARIRQAGGLFRVYVGPYQEREEARRTGERLRQEFGFTTSVAPH
ncbi:MAG: septal ring lytic transglycosylase RlpA family protein [Casimicrobiaceae bacterium]